MVKRRPTRRPSTCWWASRSSGPPSRGRRTTRGRPSSSRRSPARRRLHQTRRRPPRCPRPSPSATSSRRTTAGAGHWYPGKIASLDSGSYEIAYDDGESESGVSSANVRRAPSSSAPGGGYVDAVLTAPPASATEIAHSEAPKPAEQPSTVITPPRRSRGRSSTTRRSGAPRAHAARRELEALKAQLAAQAPNLLNNTMSTRAPRRREWRCRSRPGYRRASSARPSLPA